MVGGKPGSFFRGDLRVRLEADTACFKALAVEAEQITERFFKLRYAAEADVPA